MELRIAKINKLIKKERHSPKNIHETHVASESTLQERQFKEWFKTRAHNKTHQHYQATGAETKSDRIVDDMFNRLDEDGGGTLDCSEITSLFKKNQIEMSKEQVANMFGEASR